MGRDTEVTNGRITAVTVALLAMCVAVPYWVAADSRANRDRDCVNRAVAGAEIKATALEGVEHAESTAALWSDVSDILDGLNPTSPPIIEIHRKVEAYVAGVRDFRAVAEQYQPTSFETCGLPGPPPTTTEPKD